MTTVRSSQRILLLCAVHIHRLHQLSTAREDLNTYGCLKRFRDSATERSSYKKSLTMIVHCLAKRVSTQSPFFVTTNESNVDIEERIRRSQASIQRLDIPLLSTHKTPIRKVPERIAAMESKLASGQLDPASALVVGRTKSCVGYPVSRLATDGTKNGKGARGTCANCQASTHTYCLLCKRWLCNKLSDRVMAQDGFKCHIVINGKGQNPIHCEANCFFIVHQKAQQEQLKAFANDNVFLL